MNSWPSKDTINRLSRNSTAENAIIYLSFFITRILRLNFWRKYHGDDISARFCPKSSIIYPYKGGLFSLKGPFSWEKVRLYMGTDLVRTIRTQTSPLAMNFSCQNNRCFQRQKFVAKGVVCIQTGRNRSIYMCVRVYTYGTKFWWDEAYC